MITVRRIEFKAYGGTGTLIGRSFLALLALNACDVARTECQNDNCVIYQMDYDDQPPVGAMPNDATYFKRCINDYKKLNARNLHFLAPIPLDLSHTTLREVRDFAYPNEQIFSLQSLFCTGQNRAAIQELLSSAFTMGSPTSEFELSNRYGCYGDLAVNGFISERLIDTNAFAKKGLYNDLAAQLDNAVVIYAGSTDGGTANTMIDKDIRSLLQFLSASGKVVDHTRTFKLYALRTTPYSRFELAGNEEDVEVTKSILRDKFEMSKGVLENIDSQNALADNSNINTFSYYNLNDGNTEYWLDGLFLAGSDALDLTAWEAHKDNQFHPTHFTEFTLAMEAMDAIANRLPAAQNGVPAVYGYNDGGGNNIGPATLQSFFNNTNVTYEYAIYDASPNNGGSIGLDKYVRAFLLTLVTIKGQMIHDFRNFDGAPLYVPHIFKHGEQAMDAVCPLIADELEKFIDECKFIVMTMYDAMQYSKYGANNSPIQMMEDEIKYLYSTDTLNNQIAMPAGSGLSINDDGGAPGYRKVELSTEPYFYELDRMHDIKYHPPKGLLNPKDKLKNEELYLNIGGTSPADSAFRIANNMITRTFETYLGMMD